ncbi:septal ring lytic transglycosylase RlpA family protein [Thalassotalea euphylliae]|uniref:septal ring lytic transglycosylase RlpA family protein n=1 Tax=Thalassotalea euphylliae TaxID=1655234 RepID=UPI0036330682
MMNRLRSALYVSTAILLVGCSMQSGRYQQTHDSTPSRLPSASELRDATPRFEPKSRGGNKHYTVRGKYYEVMDNAVGFTETGIASWYGNKFHGHLTSNGEIYDMYGMSAAHKHLPLPTYVKVTNLANQQSVIVRVNDRGPFHQSRVIDLSYSAAYKIGMLKTGTANVKIEAITKPIVKPVIEPQVIASSEPNITRPLTTTEQDNNIFIQVFATRNKVVAQNTAAALSSLYQQNVIFPEENGIYRVKMGPFEESFDTSELVASLRRSGYESAYRRKILQ